MTSLYATTSRIIDERQQTLLAVGRMADDVIEDSDARIVRLVGAAMALVRQHIVDGKGRCRICTRRRWWRRIRTRPCTVYTAMSFYLTQPDELVLRQLPKPASSAMPVDAERTVRLARASPR